MIAWFLGLEDVLSWLLVKGKRDAITVDINAIVLFRQAIGSSPGINDGTARPESIGSVMHFGISVDDEVLQRVETLLKESTFADQVVTTVVDTEEDCTENDGWSGKMVCDYSLQPRQVDPDIVHASHGLQEHVLRVG
ncbi:hypothetical protein Tco_1249430 [Tanacetum coccineum]